MRDREGNDLTDETIFWTQLGFRFVARAGSRRQAPSPPLLLARGWISFVCLIWCGFPSARYRIPSSFLVLGEGLGSSRSEPLNMMGALVLPGQARSRPNRLRNIRLVHILSKEYIWAILYILY